MFSGPPPPVCAMVRAPVLSLLIVGTKETETWHVEPGSTGLPQVFVSEKSLVVVTEVIVTGAEEALVRVTRCGNGVAPAYCVPNVSDVAETAIESSMPMPANDTTSNVELEPWEIDNEPRTDPVVDGVNVTLMLHDNA